MTARVLHVVASPIRRAPGLVVLLVETVSASMLRPASMPLTQWMDKSIELVTCALDRGMARSKNYLVAYGGEFGR